MSNEDFTADLTMLCFNAEDIASIFTALVKSEQLEMNPSNSNNNNNNNGFRVRFGVRRRHREPPFARGYHQFIIIGWKPGRRGKQKVGILVSSVV